LDADKRLGAKRNVKKQFSEAVELALNKPAPDLWDNVLRAFTEALSKAEATYLRKAKSTSFHVHVLRESMSDVCAGFNCTEEENENAIASLRQRAWLSLRSKIDEQTVDSVMLVKLKLAFEDRFRYDAEGVPRVWRPEDDIDSAFRKAKDEVGPCSFAPWLHEADVLRAIRLWPSSLSTPRSSRPMLPTRLRCLLTRMRQRETRASLISKRRWSC
jgi:hypothetical protein